ncbi:MAG TPA: AAA family ATPase [Flavobacterium sp.]|nr:AAA family ATPase [Flavobacterium sp.]
MSTIKFSLAREMYKEMPPKKMLWSGVKEKSFGLVFGPPKSGKTIFCEYLAISIAIGRESYFNHFLDGNPKKVLFIGLEESFESRLGRNILQYETLTEEEKLLMDENYDVQEIDFPKFVISKENWENLYQTIEGSGAEVVFIDSITRMNHGKLEDSKTAEEIMSRLRVLSQELNITLFAIHHTPKLHGNPITMDGIKGSSVFAQESDFAIGINRTDRNHRYVKNVFFRYDNDDDEFVKEFEISANACPSYSGEVDEDEILQRLDRRRAVDKREVMKDFFNSNPNVIYTLKQAVDVLKPLVGLQERQIKTYLSELSNNQKIKCYERGHYSSVYYRSIGEGGKNE